MKKTLIFILIFLLLATGCLAGKSDSEKSVVIERVEYGHGIVEPDPNTGILIYTGEPIKLTYQIDNGNVPINLGLMLFLDGYVQPFKVNGGSTDISHTFDFSGRATVDYEIEFDPVTGDEGQEIFLYIVGIYDIKSTPDTTSSLPFLHALSQAYPLVVKFEKTSEEQSVTIPFMDISEIKTDNDSDKSSFFSLTHETGTNDAFLELQADGEYRIYLYINNDPVFYTDILTDGKNKKVLNLDLTAYKDIDFLYAIAVPTHNHERTESVPILKTVTQKW